MGTKPDVNFEQSLGLMNDAYISNLNYSTSDTKKMCLHHSIILKIIQIYACFELRNSLMKVLLLHIFNLVVESFFVISYLRQ